MDPAAVQGYPSFSFKHHPYFEEELLVFGRRQCLEPCRDSASAFLNFSIPLGSEKKKKMRGFAVFS